MEQNDRDNNSVIFVEPQLANNPATSLLTSDNTGPRIAPTTRVLSSPAWKYINYNTLTCTLKKNGNFVVENESEQCGKKWIKRNTSNMFHHIQVVHLFDPRNPNSSSNSPVQQSLDSSFMPLTMQRAERLKDKITRFAIRKNIPANAIDCDELKDFLHELHPLAPGLTKNEFAQKLMLLVTKYKKVVKDILASNLNLFR